MRAIIASSIDSPEGLEFAHIEPGSGERYAILSHTWGADGDEVVYTDILEGKARSRITYENKIAFTCRRAAADGYKYVWIDTCCIDKRSSAELSEAINSMFNWYRQSAVCYALLSDVPSTTEINASSSAFAKARWFTRGFTLQELLAPPDVVFYSKDLIELGTKASLGDTLAAITKIDIAVLIGDRPIESTSIANRMGWAANRVTKRPEDIAYCLMGIFSVNMPLLYGEGTKAFIRLQEEIMKFSTDYSIFAWFDETAAEDELRGVLARSPSMFSKTSAICPFLPEGRQEPYSMTNMGLSIRLPVNGLGDSSDNFVACVPCPTPISDDTFFGIFLKKLGTTQNDMRFARVRAAAYCTITPYQCGDKVDIYLSIHPSQWGVTAAPISPLSRPIIYFDRLLSRPFQVVSVAIYPGGDTHFLTGSSGLSGPLPGIYLTPGANQITCAILIKFMNKGRFLILLGTGNDASMIAYHVLKQNIFPTSGHQIPDVEELKASYHQPKPLGEKFLFEDAEFFLREGERNGQQLHIKMDVWPGLKSKQDKVSLPKNGGVKQESSNGRLRKHLSRMKLFG